MTVQEAINTDAKSKTLQTFFSFFFGFSEAVECFGNKEAATRIFQQIIKEGTRGTFVELSEGEGHRFMQNLITASR